MSHIVPPCTGPWRLLLLDRSDPDDPKWIIATVALAADVRSAALDRARGYTDWLEITRWVRAALGRSEVALVPLPDLLAWRIDESEQPR